MFKIISIIAGWFTSGGAIASFFAWFGVKFTSKTFIVGTQVSTIVFLFSARIAFLIAVLNVGKLTINSINLALNSLPTSFNSDEFLSIGYQIMQSIGLISALLDAFDLFNSIFISILLAWALKFAFHTAKMTSDEFFKLGMLLQA